MTPELVHGVAVALHGPQGWTGVLLVGPSGAGKSDVALRLIEAGARLVADDAVHLRRHGGRLHAACPPSIAGLIEVRGLGPAPVPSRPTVRLTLVVDCRGEPPERLPEPEFWSRLGLDLPLIRVDARAPSAAATIRLAARRLQSGPGLSYLAPPADRSGSG